VVAEEPDVHRDEPAEDGDHDRRQEERPEDARHGVHEPLRDDRRAELQREERVDLLQLLLLAFAYGDHAERLELLLDEHLHHLAVEAALEALGDPLADLVVASLPVDLLRDEVEELRHLHHLAVRAARDERGVLEPRACVLADQLDTRRELRRLRGRGGDGRAAVGLVGDPAVCRRRKVVPARHDARRVGVGGNLASPFE
jgi:hypothetical protein